MAELWETLLQLSTLLGRLAVELLGLGLRYALLLAWLAYALGGINWRKAWPVLARGAWVPAVVALVALALVWSQVAPAEAALAGLVTVANFWWQLGAVALLAGATLFCGWLQGVFRWTPAEIDLEPPAHLAHDHGHGHHA